MAQASLHRFFNTRKRPAHDEISKISKKVLLLEQEPPKDAPITEEATAAPTTRASKRIKQKLDFGQDAPETSGPKTPRKEKKIVSFTQAGPLSPKKRLRSRAADAAAAPPKTILKATTEPASLVPNDLNAPPPNAPRKLKRPAGELTLGDIKGTLSLPENARIVRESLKQFAELDRKRQELRKLNAVPIKAAPATNELQSPGKQLKPFSAIELDIESPCKEFKTPEKVLKTPTPKKLTDHEAFMSPRPATVRNPKRLLFSPAKGAAAAAAAESFTTPAHEKYRHLIAPVQSLELPYKYRCLEELFKCCDTVCAIFFNRKERITFKKLRPAVERMCKKTFTEQHLAQIVHVLPAAYELHQHKMRNFGSVSKYDYYQLVITPVLAEQTAAGPPAAAASQEATPDEKDLLNSQRLLERVKQFHTRLFHMTADQHDQFLRDLQPPMTVVRAKLMRWHPDFDIQSCPDVPRAELPLPPNVDKFSSAKDVLSAARNLFHCATPMERALARLEAKKVERQEQKEKEREAEVPGPVVVKEEEKGEEAPVAEAARPDPVSAMLKGVPESLLAKIREKQAAKALSVMTRRPSQEKEAIVYARLPDLARHVRNVFVTEKKACLATELVLKKIMNSFRASLPANAMDEHLRLLAKVSEGWITYHEIQKVRYMKLSRQTDFAQMMDRLKKLADEKCAD